MLDAQAFNAALSEAGIDFFTGVPCSLLGALMQNVEKNHSYIGATIEGEALALAAGAWLAGKKPAVFLQNSGLGNLVNTLTSLNAPFGIPALLVIGWRGMPGIKDEPQHETMGNITPQLLELMGISYHILSGNIQDARNTVQLAADHMMETRKPVALLVKPRTFAGADPQALTNSARANHRKRAPIVKSYGNPESQLPTRYEILTDFSALAPSNAAVIATTGKCGRELFSIEDRNQQLYMVGAMGSASALGLGAALHTQKPIIILDGDGAALMRLGTFALIGREKPANLIHILLDNGAHDSTGGQTTGSGDIDFCTVAGACGYTTTSRAFGTEAFGKALYGATQNTNPHFIHVPILPGSRSNLLRPTIAPHDVASRFAQFLAQSE